MTFTPCQPSSRRYAADFARVEPDCFEDVDEFLHMLEMRHLEKFEPTQVYFTSPDAAEGTAPQRAVAGWINDYIYVEPLVPCETVKEACGHRV